MTRPIEELLSQPGGIADQLRVLRREAGLTGAQLAGINGWPPSKISKLENGRQTPSADDLLAWASACGRPDAAENMIDLLEEVQTQHRDWRRTIRAGQVAVQAGYNDLIRNATVVRDFTLVYVPSLIQTPQYARYPMLDGVTLHGAAEAEVDDAVTTRMQRQQYVYDPGKRFEFLLDESVLRRLICPPQVMRGQLDRLQTVIGMENVRFGILPFGRQLPVAPQNAFTVVDDVVLVEAIVGESTHLAEKAATYVKAIDLLWGCAAEGGDARALIVDAARCLPDG